ncbi:MAG: PAS domain S-box protein [Alkalinema sp. RU_4_3]|nr:PAS domain S-box protein [Alkalinema sp. RU_4_3]
MEYLIEVVQQLSLAADLQQTIEIACQAARALTGADGATFVLREVEMSYYVNEEAIAPLWKGQKFPIDNCIGGWCIRHAQTVEIADVFADDRIPKSVYAETFVKSMVMVPIREIDPIGAIGNYWTDPHIATTAELKLLKMLANATSIAIGKIQIHQELNRQTAELEDLYNRAPCGYHSLGPDGKYLRINDTALKMLGYTSEELIGQQTPRDLMTPVSQKIFDRQFPIFLDQGWIGDLELEMVRKDGTLLTVSLNARAVYDDSGNYQMSRATIVDISDRVRVQIEQQQATTALQEAQQRIVTSWESMTDAYTMLDLDWRLVYANQTALKMFQALLSIDDAMPLIGQSHWEIFPWSVGQSVEIEYRRAMRDQVPVHFEVFYEPSGTWIEIHAYPSAVSLGIYFRDITDRKAAEQERERFLAVGSDLQVTMGQNGFFKWVSPSFEQTLGWTALELTTHPWVEFVHPDDVDRSVAEVSNLFAGKETLAFEHRMRQKDGTYRWLLWRAQAYLEEATIYATAVDITNKKQLESQFLRAQRLESLGTLASGIAHDMNNILTPILAASQLLPLQLTDIDDRSRTLVQIVGESARRGTDLVRQILSFARGSDGTRTSIQIRHILSEVIRVARQTFPKSIEVSLNLATTELWLISADPTQLHQVLMNLCINARDAMPEGGNLSISADNLVLDQNDTKLNIDAQVGPYVLVTITDTGTGIPAELLEKIFEPFFTTKEAGHGTGLGLSTTLGIIKSHGGFVNVDSELGQGTRFDLYLPKDLAKT